MATQLSVNLNAVAFLRNRRDLPWPNVVELGRIALEAGAAGLTVHPRPDERHIRRADVLDLARLLGDHFPDREFNIEGYPDARYLALVEEIKPAQATLVPDDPNQATSDHGWDFARFGDFLSPIIARLKSQGMRVSVFVDADPSAPEGAARVGADRIELYTGPYGGTYDDPEAARRELDKLAATAEAASRLGLGLNAGHDLTTDNLPPLIARVPTLLEVSIGHALIGESLTYGMAEAVRRFRRAAGQSS